MGELNILRSVPGVWKSLSECSAVVIITPSSSFGSILHESPRLQIVTLDSTLQRHTFHPTRQLRTVCLWPLWTGWQSVVKDLWYLSGPRKGEWQLAGLSRAFPGTFHSLSRSLFSSCSVLEQGWDTKVSQTRHGFPLASRVQGERPSSTNRRLRTVLSGGRRVQYCSQRAARLPLQDCLLCDLGQSLSPLGLCPLIHSGHGDTFPA